MAKYVNGVLVDEGKKGGASVNVYTAGEKDTTIVEVTTGVLLGEAHLTKVPDEDDYEGVSHFRPGSTLPVVFHVEHLGDETTVENVAGGMHDVDTPKFDALAFFDAHDDAEYIAALTDAERAELSNITYLELKAITVGSHAHNPPNTAKENAAVAIIQREGLPQPGQGNNTSTAAGALKIVDVLLTIGTHPFTQDTTGFGVERKVCGDIGHKGQVLYKFSWTGVPVSVFDEVKK